MRKLPPPMNLEGMNLEAIHEAIQDCHDWPGRNHPDDAYHLGIRAVCTAMRLESALEAAQQEIAARDAEIAGLRPIPADRELMRLVDELIRWHGLRPLDKRPDHAAVLVGAIKALRAQPTQEPAT